MISRTSPGTSVPDELATMASGAPTSSPASVPDVTAGSVSEMLVSGASAISPPQAAASSAVAMNPIILLTRTSLDCPVGTAKATACSGRAIPTVFGISKRIVSPSHNAGFWQKLLDLSCQIRWHNPVVVANEVHLIPDPN